MKPVTLIMLGAGVWLLYSAIANKQPLGVLANAVGYKSSNSSVTGTAQAPPATETTPSSAAAPPNVSPTQWAQLQGALTNGSTNLPVHNLGNVTIN